MSKPFQGLCAVERRYNYTLFDVQDRTIQQMLNGGIRSSEVIDRRRKMQTYCTPLTQLRINFLSDTLLDTKRRHPNQVDFIDYFCEQWYKLGFYYPFEDPPVITAEKSPQEKDWFVHEMRSYMNTYSFCKNSRLTRYRRDFVGFNLDVEFSGC